MLVDGRRVLGFGDWLFFVVVVSDDFSARIYTQISLTIGCFDPYSIDSIAMSTTRVLVPLIIGEPPQILFVSM
jgi:hypothetical protein